MQNIKYFFRALRDVIHLPEREIKVFKKEMSNKVTILSQRNNDKIVSHMVQ